jgi:hypothetical protein
MSYKYSFSGLIKALLSKIGNIFQEPWSLAVSSYRTSKFVFFFQIMNIILVLYVATKIVPYLHLEKISSYLQAPHNSFLFLLFIYFVFKVMVAFKMEEFSLSNLLTTNLQLTLFIFFILCVLICVYNFYFIKLKNYVKPILEKI